MKRSSEIIKYILLLVFLISCKYKYNVDQNNIIGVWESKVMYPNMNGIERITCYENSSVSIEDSLVYTLEEENMEVSVECRLLNSGTWSIQNNLLIFDLQKLSIEMNPSSLMISSYSPDLYIDTLNINYSIFKQELCNHIKEDIMKNFHDDVKGKVEIGEIKVLSTTTLQIENSENILSFDKVQ